MAATDRVPLLVLVSMFACDEGGLHVAVPDPPSEGGSEWGIGEDEAPADEGSPTGLEDTGDEPDDSVLIGPGDTWRYESGLVAAPDWTTVEFDDTHWSIGTAPLGAGFEVGTTLPPGPSRFRAQFELLDPSAITGLGLRLRRDDGAIAWLNGVEVVRSNMPTIGVDPAVLAASRATGHDAYHYYWGFPDPNLLRSGTNVLAVSLHRVADDDDLVLDAMLQSLDPSVAPEELAVQLRTVGYSGEYAPKHVGAIWIEDAGGFVRTLEVWGDVRREHLIAWRLSSDDNDVDAVTSSTRASHGTHLVNWDLRRHDGTLANAGVYRLQVEFTEANSNDGDPAGPRLTVEFELGAGANVLETATNGDDDRFAELLLYTP